MPKVGNKTFPFTPEGWKEAKAYAKKNRISRIQGAFSMKKYKQLQKEKNLETWWKENDAWRLNDPNPENKKD